MSLADVAKKYSFIKDLNDLPIKFIYSKGYEEEFLQFVCDSLEAEIRDGLENSRRLIMKGESHD